MIVGYYALRYLISIHALREEGDSDDAGPKRQHANFYPRPPRGGRPPAKEGEQEEYKISIHALREEGDPKAFAMGPSIFSDFYPRPPRGGRHRRMTSWGGVLKISIHALREEGDGSDRR